MNEKLQAIKEKALLLPKKKQVELVRYLLKETDLNMREIGYLVGRSESGVYRINAGDRHFHCSVEYPVRQSRTLPDKPFHPARILEYIEELMPEWGDFE